MISFATEAGKTADDGTADHSPYTAALLGVLDQPGLKEGRMFRSVRARVKETTGGAQVPIEKAQLPDQDIYLVCEIPDRRFRRSTRLGPFGFVQCGRSSGR